jgi:toxin ParE1/3/4
MAKPTYSPSFEDDLKYLAAFIAQDKPDAARKWVQQVRRKCRLIANHPYLGDSREELGLGVRSTYVGNYIVFFRAKDRAVEIMRLIRGGREIRFL